MGYPAIRTDNPVADAAVWFTYQEEQHKRYIMGNAYCFECGRQIVDDECYIFTSGSNPSPYNGSMCKACGQKHLRNLKNSNLDAWTADFIQNCFWEALGKTPNKLMEE